MGSRQDGSDHICVGDAETLERRSHLLALRVILLGDDPGGVTIQCYCAVIACTLLALWGGKKPDKATWRMAYWFITGLAGEDDLLAHVNRPDNRGVKLRAKEELWKKLGY